MDNNNTSLPPSTPVDKNADKKAKHRAAEKKYEERKKAGTVKHQQHPHQPKKA